METFLERTDLLVQTSVRGLMGLLTAIFAIDLDRRRAAVAALGYRVLFGNERFAVLAFDHF